MGAAAAANGEALELLGHDVAFARLWAALHEREDSFRDRRFKVIPRVVDGPWIVRKTIGGVPALTGTKIRQLYHMSPLDAPRLQGAGRYFELDLDVNSSAFACTVCGMVIGYASSLAVDLAFILQGESEEELPERILGSLRLNRPAVNALPFITLDGTRGRA